MPTTGGSYVPGGGKASASLGGFSMRGDVDRNDAQLTAGGLAAAAGDAAASCHMSSRRLRVGVHAEV